MNVYGQRIFFLIHSLIGQYGNFMLQLPMVQTKSNYFLGMTWKCFHGHANSPVLIKWRRTIWCRELWHQRVEQQCYKQVKPERNYINRSISINNCLWEDSLKGEVQLVCVTSYFCIFLKQSSWSKTCSLALFSIFSMHLL